MVRSAIIRKLVGTGWGASPSTLRTSSLSLVYSPPEYCAPTCSRGRHTSLLDVRLNCTLRIITRFLQPTPVEQLPVLPGIPLAELHRRAASLALVCRAMDPYHPLHNTITREETQPRLKSWCSFATSGKDLLSTTLPNETKAHWIGRMLSAEWRFDADMWRWGLSKNPPCDCRADQQTANHIISECPLYRPPNGLHGLIDVDADAATCEWLLSKFLGI